MDKDISKLFKKEVMEKKKIGRGIFSRVSTRKGGTNQALRTPYLYMSNKERKSLNGEVKVYNMNDIMSWNEFNALKDERQLELMKLWRTKYKAKEIIDGLGISNYVFYKRLGHLGLEIDRSKVVERVGKISLSQEELEIALSTEGFISFEKFKTLKSNQQDILMKRYLENFNDITADVIKAWEGSESSYVYYIASRTRKKERPSLFDSKSVKKTGKVSVSDSDSYSNSNKDKQSEASAIDVKSEEISNHKHEDSVVDNDTQIKKDHIKTEISASSNNFSFELHGDYMPESIVRRLKLIEEELLETNEMLQIQISIRSLDN